MLSDTRKKVEGTCTLCMYTVQYTVQASSLAQIAASQLAPTCRMSEPVGLHVQVTIFLLTCAITQGTIWLPVGSQF